MKQVVSFSLIFSLVFPAVLPLYPSLASEIELNESSESLLSQRGRGGGGRRGGGSRGASNRHINRGGLGSSGSGRINRSSSRSSNRRGNVNRSSNRRGNVNRSSNRRGNVNRPSTRPGNRPGDRINNRPDDRRRVDRRRDINIDSRRRNTNRINRNIINNGNIVVNPRRGWGRWGWNGGTRWYPNYSYWGGGFWGGFAVGAFTTAVTGAIINSSSTTTQTNYIVIEKNTPGYYLFDSYGLTQVQCDSSQDLVFIYGPQDTLMCARPNSLVAAGYYDVDPEDLVLVFRDY